jgi:predicted RNA-binding protein with PIN domain
MARVVIDGYNLLPATTFRDREKLVAALADYRKLRNHDVTVVFDGTHDGTGTGDRSFASGVEVVYSPLTVTADDVIEAMLPRLDANTTIVVSSDRKIQNAARRAGMVFLSSQEFARRLRETSSRGSQGAPPPWMEGRTDEEERPREKKGASKKLSKEERRKKRSMKKL